MYERFSVQMLEAAKRAGREAQKRNHDEIRPEHLLLAISQVANSTGASALAAFRVGALEIAEHVAVPRSSAEAEDIGRRAFSPPSEQVIEAAIEAARAENRQWIGTGHLLLALLQFENPFLKEVLSRRKISPRELERITFSQLNRESSAESIPGMSAMHLEKNMSLRRSMLLAAQVAESLHHEHIGTEHLLIGMVEEEEGAAGIVLRNLGVDSPKARQELRRMVPAAARTVKSGERPLTPQAEDAFEIAAEEAHKLQHASIGTGHLLFGLLGVKAGLAYQILSIIKVDLIEIRRLVRHLMSTER